MSGKTLKFNNIRVNKKEFHKSKKPIDANQIAVSDKFKHSDNGLNFLLVTKKVKLLNRYVLSYLK